MVMVGSLFRKRFITCIAACAVASVAFGQALSSIDRLDRPGAQARPRALAPGSMRPLSLRFSRSLEQRRRRLRQRMDSQNPTEAAQDPVSSCGRCPAARFQDGG